MTHEDGIPDPGIPRVPIDRLDLDSEEIPHYIAAERPFVAKVDWPALRWDPTVLRERIGHAKIKARKVNAEVEEITVREWLDILDDPDGKGAGYAIVNGPAIKVWKPPQDKGFGPNPEMESLMDDFEIPAFVDRRFLSSINIWASNRAGYYDNKSHADPYGISNFNVQLRGKKRMWLFPPGDAPYLGTGRLDFLEPPMSAGNQEAYETSEAHPRFGEAHCHEAVLEPGDGIFIPPWWFHWIVHYPVYQLNLNIWWMGERFQLNPLSTVWAYLNAVCMTLGGFEHMEENFKKLPAETQKLLHDIENTLLRDERLTQPRLANPLRLMLDSLMINPKYFEKRDRKISDYQALSPEELAKRKL